jgi:hypothetical protein
MVGHLTMLISGQETGVLSLTGEDGKPFLLKGMSRKLVESAGEDAFDEEGKYSHTRVSGASATWPSDRRSSRWTAGEVH